MSWFIMPFKTNKIICTLHSFAAFRRTEYEHKHRVPLLHSIPTIHPPPVLAFLCRITTFYNDKKFQIILDNFEIYIVVLKKKKKDISWRVIVLQFVSVIQKVGFMFLLLLYWVLYDIVFVPRWSKDKKFGVKKLPDLNK